MEKFKKSVMEECRTKILKIPCLLLLMLMFGLGLQAQGLQVKGVILDSNGESVIGASIVLKGNTAVGTISDIDGNFTLSVPNENATLVVSFIGMKSQEIKVNSKKLIRVILEDDSQQLDEVIVVGYGQQKKASVVGAITQTTGQVLERAAGITDIGAALTGNLPGVITTSDNGMPGGEEPKITIRGASSWNNSDPLVLVDGVERPMSSVDMASVETLSVLKDASATAVYGVKGANGVILITTKRGAEGKAKINVSANAVMKTPSRLPNKLDSYDAYMARNMIIEHELNLNPDSWNDIRPQSFIDNFRNQTTVEQRERYPNVDWKDVLFKDFAMSYNANVNISGGTKFVKYFASMDYVHEGDLYREFKTGRGYDNGFGYDRINMRTNLDFNITKTTVFKVSLAGSSGQTERPYYYSSATSGSASKQAGAWAGVYTTPPDVFLPVYSDGSLGYYPSDINMYNSVDLIATGGAAQHTTTRITTDFVLEQKLDFITKGLSFRGMIAWDNTFQENDRGISEPQSNNGSNQRRKYIDPDTGNVTYQFPFETNNQFDMYPIWDWVVESGSVNNGATRRSLNYQLQLNWARDFGKHSVTAMGLFSRQEVAQGSEIPHFREDWAFRTTYDWAGRYFIEYNGAYNGSEKFSKDNRFAFFNSGAIGWMISEEPFMAFLREKKILDMMKIRVSYGEIGDDNISGRWLFQDQWAYNSSWQAYMDPTKRGGKSPYSWYRESVIGNDDVHWEKVRKLNLGIDYALLDGLFAGSIEVFRDKRSDILINGSSRAVPSYFGATPATINKGKVNTKGYELELRFNKKLENGMRLWANMSMTHAENKVIVKDDMPLLPSYRQAAGYPMGQGRYYLDDGFIGSYDELYGSPKHDSNNESRIPGDYYIIDFNGDGVINQDDQAPYGHPTTPQNTYNATIGFEWKGFSCFAQFYGVNNVSRAVQLNCFNNRYNVVFDTGTWWAEAGNSADFVTPRWLTKPVAAYNGTQYVYDASFIRLKNVEVSYTFKNNWTRQIGVSNLRLFISGNNLWMWSRMPDDREGNFTGASTSSGAYPIMKRVNLGVKFSL